MGWLSVWVAVMVIGIGSNMDNSGVGLAYGSAKIKFPHWVNAIVNGVGFCTALFGAYAGTVISRYLDVNQASWVACIVLICVGLFFWYSAYVHPRFVHKRTSIMMRKPGWREGIILGLALSFTNVASGFGATVSDTATVWATVISITVCGYLMIWLGNVVGIGLVARLLGRYASLVAGLLLILVGVHQVI